jgi:tetratricopeptide (TPR) repeat protein
LRAEFETLPVADYLAKHLPILIDVAQAVAFAHSRGVVHRDLKAAQVMTGEFGETILMDWGLAVYVGVDSDSRGSSVEQEEPLPLPSPATACNPAGTPAMMAPEQTIDDDASGVGPWTDVYLLGGILYQILCGYCPRHAPSGKEAFEIASRAEPPPHPRDRAPNREIPPALADLAMKALDPKPAQRVESAKAFLQELQNWMSGASQRRESEKLVREARDDFQALRDRAPELSASELYARRGAIEEKLRQGLRLWDGNPLARLTLVRNLAARAGEEIERGDLVLAEVHIGELRRESQEFSETAPADELIEKLAAARARRTRFRRLATGLGVTTFLLLLCSLGLAWIAWEKAQEALNNAQIAQSGERRAQLGARVARQRAQEAEAQRGLVVERLRGTFGLVDFLLNELRGQLDLSVERDQQIAKALGKGVFDYYQNVESESFSALMLQEHSHQLNTIGLRFHGLGLIDQSATLLSSALPLSEKIVGTEHPETAKILGNLAATLAAQGRLEEAETLYRRVLAIFEKSFDPNSADFGACLNNFASFLTLQGKGEEAIPLLERALVIAESVFPEDHVDLAAARMNLANACSQAPTRFGAAEKLYLQALESLKNAPAARRLDYAKGLGNLAQLYLQMGKLEDVEAMCLESLEIIEGINPAHSQIGAIAMLLYDYYARLGQIDKAQALAERIVASQANNEDIIDEHFINLKISLAKIVDFKGDLARAEQLCAEAVEDWKVLMKRQGGNAKARHIIVPIRFYSAMNKVSQHDLAGAQEFILANIDTMIELIAEEPRDDLWRRELAANLNALTEILMLREMSGQLSSEELAREREELVETIQPWMEELIRFPEGLERYVRAAHALGRQEEARAGAEKLLAAGWKNKEFLTLARELGFKKGKK